MTVLNAFALLLMLLVPLAVTATFTVKPTDAVFERDNHTDELLHDISKGVPGFTDDGMEQPVKEIQLNFIGHEMPGCLAGLCDVSEIWPGLAFLRRYISYDSLKKNHMSCNRRGKSYYNCQWGRQVNPYWHGCSFITRCARIID